MKKGLLFCALLCLNLSSFLVKADEALIARDDVQNYITHTARQTGLSSEFITETLRASQYQANIITALDKPATKWPWHRFSLHLLSPKMVADGVKFWQDNNQVLTQISQQYQVDPEIIIAILGIETQYGKNKGTFLAIDALSTIAFYYPRRAQYFQEELRDFFILTARGNKDPRSLKSSYAGALGMTQFMPSSYLKHAVSTNEKNTSDIWESPEDAIASVANYLKHFGWRKGEIIVSPMILSDTLDTNTLTNYANNAFQKTYTMADWQALGIRTAAKIPPSERTILFILDEPDHQEYYLGFHNFYVITRYNKSTLYAMAIARLAEKIKAAYQNPLPTTGQSE